VIIEPLPARAYIIEALAIIEPLITNDDGLLFLFVHSASFFTSLYSFILSTETMLDSRSEILRIRKFKL